MNIKTRIIKFRQDLLFYVYKEKKNLMIWLRLWFIARHIVDVEWSWFADIKQLSKYSKLQSSYIARICNQSIFFYSIENNKVNYVSENRVCKKLWLIHRLWRIRGEVYSNKFIKQFESDKLFKGFILKCFVESPGCKRSKTPWLNMIFFPCLLNFAVIFASSSISLILFIILLYSF